MAQTIKNYTMQKLLYLVFSLLAHFPAHTMDNNNNNTPSNSFVNKVGSFLWNTNPLIFATKTVDKFYKDKIAQEIMYEKSPEKIKT